MRPLVRLAIKRGVSVNDLYTWLKAIYVEEAESFKIEGKKQSTSRIALLTGLDRKEVARLRKLNQNMDQLLHQQAKRTNRAIRAINAWQKEAAYCKDGQPKPLPLYGDGASFQQLTFEHCGDISAVTVLKELEQSGLVEVGSDDVITLKDSSYIPHEDNEELLHLMGQAGHDLLSSAIYNINQAGKTSRLQLSVAYQRMNKHVTNKLKKLIETDSYELLKKLDQWIDQELDQQQSEDDEPQYRAGVGIYYFEEPYGQDDDQ
ncbi:conserved hypothetical protein [gamma proteobacterium HTCC5015]|nr:conserved hypothetical protein [gamma proteobacterium HTCC5015]